MALTITRSIGERVVLTGKDQGDGDHRETVIEVLEIKGRRVRISIDAPASVRIVRGELTGQG
jgi:sRNA-binding carbon storage regulator CsrA